ncbi:MAG: hypothetical protein WDN49_12565 [Acetobacteraceae bacterium]
MKSFVGPAEAVVPEAADPREMTEIMEAVKMVVKVDEEWHADRETDRKGP